MADDRTKISELPVAQSISDTDVMVAVVDDATCKAYVPLLREAFVGAETTAREAADTALGNRIDGKQDTLTFDDVPTDGSNNPVKSNGIYDALATKANTADLATVATTGDYEDLTDKPTIPVIEANPSGEATAEMQKLKIDSTIYKFASQKAYGEITNVDIASFSDGADEPLAKLEVGIEAVQNLNGYDSPWVGGAGKNIIDVSDKTVTSQTTILSGKTFPAGTYTLSTDTINNSDINCNIRVNKTGTSTIIASILIPASASTKTRRNATFTLTEETQISILCNGQSSGYSFTIQNVMLEKGSTATDFEPYSNICPISGWDEVNVTRCGVNFYNKNAKDTTKGYVNNYLLGRDGEETSNSNYEITEYIELPAFGTSRDVTLQGLQGDQVYICWYDESKAYIGQGRYSTYSTRTFTIPATAKYIRFSVYKANEDITMLVWGSEASDYAPYVSNDYTISLGETRYGGKLDVTSGVLTVDSGIVDLGTLTWGKTTQYGYTFFYSSVVSNKKYNKLCSHYKAVTKARDNLNNEEVGLYNTTNNLVPVIRDDSKASMTTDEFKTAMSGVQLVFELTTPQTVQLSATQVKTLLKGNNILADSGKIVDVVYVRDLNTYLKSLDDRITALENA